MRLKNITRALLFSVLLLAVPAIASAAGHIAPTGVTKNAASQLVAWYDETTEDFGDSFEGYSFLQVTNVSTDTGVNIHVQIFADESADSTNRCREHDFTDTLTPTDTVLYCFSSLDDVNGDGNVPCGGDNAGNNIPIDIRGTRGFVVVTAVDTVTLPRQAVSHNYLVGSMTIFIQDDNPDEALTFNAMGRKAVDVATGGDASAGVVLDGITNALQLLQPSFLFFGFNDWLDSEDAANIVSIAFSDVYSDPSGEYRASPSTAVWDPLMFNQFEQGTSCQQHVQTCFVTIGLNDDWETDIDDNGGYADVRLCPSVALDGSGDIDSGWVNIAVSGLSGLDNNLGIVHIGDDNDSDIADWMHAQ